jgi:3(or 17)beta-hydroxysteroid dehydrogenase
VLGRVAGKVALVTGGGSGLGKADCLMLAAEGAMVVVSDINLAAAQAVAAEIGENAIALKHDVSSESDWQAVLAEAEARFGGLNVLVNNAGIVVIADPEERTLQVLSLAANGCYDVEPLAAASGQRTLVLCDNCEITFDPARLFR